MIVHPPIGQRVQVWYNRRAAPAMPYHGKLGTVRVRSAGKPRNHGVEIDGKIVVVPCGNLRVPA